MKVVSLFSGIGGLDRGFSEAGFDVIWANDFDKYAVETYRANYDNPICYGDITQLPLEEIPQHDVLIGGFPCQPFSMMGLQRGFDDTRGTLFFHIADIIRYQIEQGRAPRAIVLENVRRLKTHDNGNTFATIKRVLEEDLGYKVFDMILNTADYGIPQVRNRMYIVCFKNSKVENFDAPPTTDLELTLQDMLEDDVDDRYFLSERIVPTILSNGTGGYHSNSEIDRRIARPLCATMAKMHRACQDNYVTRTKRNGEQGIRRLTPRECARLQGFDLPNEQNFIIPVSDSQAYKQFGNAVTVNVSRAVAQHVRLKLEEIGEWH